MKNAYPYSCNFIIPLEGIFQQLYETFGKGVAYYVYYPPYYFEKYGDLHRISELSYKHSLFLKTEYKWAYHNNKLYFKNKAYFALFKLLIK